MNARDLVIHTLQTHRNELAASYGVRNRPVDLGTLRSLKSRMRQRVEQDLIDLL